jgi:microcystin-dependent protein
MAGTLFGLGMSQHVDLNGKPAVGWLLYVYAANSSTPVDTFQDTALTVKNTWPILADANGMMLPFWLPDGSYRARGTNNDGSIIYFDVPSIQSIGPSTGSAPSGGVDPNAIFQTGDLIWQDFNGTRSGWVRDNGRTIGSSTSGATERANADCQSLFSFMWNNYADTICPVLGGRGVSAATDWAANKQLTLPDKRGYVPGGLDDMGNSAAGRWASAPVNLATVTTGGGKVGENAHTLSTGEIPSHNHTINVSEPPHQHTLTGIVVAGAAGFTTAKGTFTGPGGTGLQNGSLAAITHSDNATIGVTATASSTGGGGAHNNAQLTVLGTFFRKL